MKKTFTLLSALVIGFGAMAGNKSLNNETSSTKPTFNNKTITVNKSVAKTNVSRATAIWSDDFTTTSNWTISNNGTATQSWEFASDTVPTNLKNVGLDSLFMSASGGYYAVLNSDNYGATGVQDANITTTNSINLSGHPNVQLKFNQYYAKYDDTCNVQVSTNGTSWTTFQINTQYANNGGSTNPELITLNISSVAGNQGTVWVRFNFVGAYAYGWMIDDVSIEDMPSVDASVYAGFFLNNQGDACGLTTDKVVIGIINKGASNIANGEQVSYQVNGGTVVNESAAWVNGTAVAVSTVAPGDTAYHIFTTLVNLSSVGTTYNASTFIKLANDADATNDSASFSITHLAPLSVNTSATYSEDFESQTLGGFTTEDTDASGLTWALANAGYNSSAVSLRAFENNTNRTSDDWAFSRCLDLQTGLTYTLSFYQRLSTGYSGKIETKIGTSDASTSMSQQIGTFKVLAPNGTYSLNTKTFTVANNGTYYIGFHAVNVRSDSSIALRIDNINLSAVTTPTGIAAINSNNIEVYPNPASNQLTVKVSANSDSYFVAYDATGRKVKEVALTTIENNLNIADLANGLYIYHITDKNKTVTNTGKFSVVK